MNERSILLCKASEDITELLQDYLQFWRPPSAHGALQTHRGVH